MVNDPPSETSIKKWWTQWPRANIGILTGGRTGLVVLDLDPRHGGDQSLRQLEQRFGPLPHTVEQITGSGGKHFLFLSNPGAKVQSKVAIAPGLDLRADGGLIVAPPSLHACGNRYEWRPDRHPDNTSLAHLPSWLLNLDPEKRNDGPVEGKIREGQRNALLHALGSSMRAAGFGLEAIRAALLTENEKSCSPPLAEAEIDQTIMQSVSQYRPNKLKGAKPPSFQFYPGDWQRDPQLQACSLTARGLMIELLCLMHWSDRPGYLLVNGRPPDTKMISNLTRTNPKRVQKCLDELMLNGVIKIDSELGAIYSKRMVKDAEIRRIRAECGKLGGNPYLLKREDKQTEKK